MRIEITIDCFCEHYLHEVLHYPRPGLVETKFKKGDILEVEEEWSNMYGRYYKCDVGGRMCDVSVSNARQVMD